MTIPDVQQRIKIYPRSVKGLYRNIKTSILVFAYGVYFLLPWLRWQRMDGTSQAVLFDIHNRKFYLFDLIVHAQDIVWLAGILIIAALLLFFVTGVWGRVFCGYFCFQTLWTDVFMFLERLIQGERPARMKLAESPWNAEKIFKISTTYLAWLLVAFLTGLAFTLYWGDAYELIGDMFILQAPFAAYATTIFLTLTTFVMAGVAREQVCTYMCPYARFQGVMFDQDTAIVAFDYNRGERQGGRVKVNKNNMDYQSRVDAGSGDCVDCGYCVQVCPTGIDIRNGMQYQCISCALCIDACNNIMDALKYPRGLIRYTSDNELAGGKTKWWKAKNIAYGLTLMAAILILAISVISRKSFEMSIDQIRQPLYVLLADNSIQNRYEVKLNNKTEYVQHVTLSVSGIQNIQLETGYADAIELKPGQRITLPIKVTMAHTRDLNELEIINFIANVTTNTKQGTTQFRYASHFNVPKKREP